MSLVLQSSSNINNVLIFHEVLKCLLRVYPRLHVTLLFITDHSALHCVVCPTVVCIAY